ncbi:MAG: PKD domain-containing protein [Candidatus Heimdallarchaeota archaeon]
MWKQAEKNTNFFFIVLLAIAVPAIIAAPEPFPKLMFRIETIPTPKEETTLTLSESKAGYQDRKNELLERAVERGDVQSAIAKLWLNRDVAGANAILTNYANRDLSDRGSYWAAPSIVRAYYTFKEGSTFANGKYAGRLYSSTERAIMDYMRRFLDDPEIGIHYSNPQGVDFIKGWVSENHMAHQTQTYLFGSHILGRTEKYAQWKDYWNRLLDHWGKRGFIETGSGDYVIRTMGPILNVYDFLPDSVVRKKAEMILDWMWAEWAQENIKGVRGGGKIREYTNHASWGDQDGLYESAYVLFGTGKLTGHIGMHTIFIATTNYYPPDVIIDLAVDRYGRGTYEIKQRRMNAYAYPKKSNSRRYVYVTPKYILGGFQSDADKLYEPWGAEMYWSGQKLWEGVIFDTTPDARIFFEELYSPSETFLHKNVLVISDFFFDWDDPQGWEPHHEARAVFPDNVLDEIVEDSGWIFVREGDVYAAYKPIGGYRWGELYTEKKYVGKTAISRSEESPAILEVGLASDYNNDFAKFRADIKDNPLSYSDGVLKYTSCKGDALTFYTGSGLPQVNGKTVDWETYPLFKSPYINSEWESGYVVISKDERKCTLDFRDFNNPIKTCEILKDVTPPVADAGSDQTVAEDTLVTLDGSGSSDNVGITNYTWTFMDVTSKTLTGVNPTYTFSTPGTYTVALKVTDAAGNHATDTVTIKVLDVTKPVANAGPDQTVEIGTTVAFNAGGSSDNVAVVRYEWDFGDGTTGTGITTTHTYTEPGTYAVTLTVEDAAGNSDTDSVVVTVLPVSSLWWIGGVMAAVIAFAVLVLWRRKASRG